MSTADPSFELSASADAAVAPRAALSRHLPRGLPVLATPDPVMADALLDGRFHLAGHEVAMEDASPFTTPSPDPAWLDALHGFDWLIHLAPAETGGAARAIAVRHYIEAWADLGPRMPALALRPGITARRVLAWLCAAPVLRIDEGLAARVSRLLALQVAWLKAAAPALAPRPARLDARIAIAAHAVCCGTPRAIIAATTRLDDEIARQILPDGGHVTRDPVILADSLLKLTALHAAMLQRGVSPSQPFNGALDRMTPMLGFFQHGDGAFASFACAAPLRPASLDALKRHRARAGMAVRNAVYSGYQRLDAGEATLIADAGEMAPVTSAPRAGSGPGLRAAASALAFEFSDGAQRLIVNCGCPPLAAPEWQEAARTTAAHSTLTLDNLPSAPIKPARGSIAQGVIARGPIARVRGRFAKAPRIGVEVSRGLTQSGERLDLRHAGYAERFGLVHARTLALVGDGRTLVGCDALESVGVSASASPIFTLRFHLDPRLAVGRADRGIRLLMPEGGAWTFLCDRPVQVEESVCVTPERGLRPTRQIVVTGEAAPGLRVRWKLSKG